MHCHPIANPRQAGPTKERAAVPGHPDPADPVECFRRLVDARRRHDIAAARPLYVELRAMGWQVVPCEPKRAREAK